MLLEIMPHPTEQGYGQMNARQGDADEPEYVNCPTCGR
jgi:hypothetical protein